VDVTYLLDIFDILLNFIKIFARFLILKDSCAIQTTVICYLSQFFWSSPTSLSLLSRAVSRKTIFLSKMYDASDRTSSSTGLKYFVRFGGGVEVSLI
jgi:hypothetical protein